MYSVLSFLKKILLLLDNLDYFWWYTAAYSPLQQPLMKKLLKPLTLTLNSLSCPLFPDKPNKRVTGDPDKTLFVGKFNKDTSEGLILSEV